MLPILADVDFISSGTSALSTIWTWVQGNPALSAMLGIAVAGVGVSMILGIFFRRG